MAAWRVVPWSSALVRNIFLAKIIFTEKYRHAGIGVGKEKLLSAKGNPKAGLPDIVGFLGFWVVGEESLNRVCADLKHRSDFCLRAMNGAKGLDLAEGMRIRLKFAVSVRHVSPLK